MGVIFIHTLNSKQVPTHVQDFFCFNGQRQNQNRTEQNITLLKRMHLRPLTGGVIDSRKHVVQ